MAYPATKVTFTDPAGTSLLTQDPPTGGHAGLHTDINDTVEAIEDTLGTTGGTSVLKSFVAGNFPARINASNVLQQAISGTITGSNVSATSGTISGMLIGTSTITGGTINTALHSNPLNVAGSITQSGAAADITLTAGASQVVRFTAITQGTYTNNLSLQVGNDVGTILSAGSEVAGTTTFTRAFTAAPKVTLTVNETGATFAGANEIPTIRLLETTSGTNFGWSMITREGTVSANRIVGFDWFAFGPTVLLLVSLPILSSLFY